MAIIKTGNTRELATEVALKLMEMLTSSAEVAAAAKTLATALEEAPPGVSDGNLLDGTPYRIELGDSRASYSESYGGAPESGWSKSGSSKYSFVGSHLDAPAPGAPSLAERFSLASTQTFSRNEPGFSGKKVYSERIDAALEFNRATPGSIGVGNFTQVGSTSESESGVSGPGSSMASKLVRSSESLTFRGFSTLEFSGADPVVRSASVQSISWAFTGSRQSEWDGDSATQAGRFSLRSDSGLSYTHEAGGAKTLTGAFDALTYDWRSDVSSAEGAWQVLNLYKYVNAASPADDIDLQAFLDYQRLGSYDSVTQLMEQLYKGDDQVLITDHLWGGEVHSGAGNDKVIGGRAGDEIDGGEGNDAIIGGGGSDNLKGQAGDDSIRGDAGNDSLDGGSGSDRLQGGAGFDQISGGDGDDLLDGGSGNDRLDGDGGNDVLKGGAGEDSLRGGLGDDRLDGGAGNDLIIGGEGRDLLTGGTGIDGFAFGVGDSGDAAFSLGSLDQITDFNVAQDQILIYFNTVFAADSVVVFQGARSYSELLEAANAADQRVAIGYDRGSTYVFVDIDGNGSLDLAIQLLGIKGDTLANSLDIRAV